MSPPAQVPSAGTATDTTSDVSPASSADTPLKDRSVAIAVTGSIVTIAWLLIVFIKKLPGIALVPLLVVIVICIVGISLTRRNGAGRHWRARSSSWARTERWLGARLASRRASRHS